MTRILYGTIWIWEDEPCLGLYELNLQSPGSRGFHRYQIIRVIRDDKEAEYREDLGLASNWVGTDQFRIPGGAYENGKFYIEETVGSLRDIANYLRSHKLSEIVGFSKEEMVKLDHIREK